ncbi:MAG: hypothetical protein H6558_13350 [Lewinellaceae bacterium]|nr:hypothetical protein [Lewinellaceae bacterium]
MPIPIPAAPDWRPGRYPADAHSRKGNSSTGTDADPDSGFRSRFHHEREKASPGYYAVHLEDYDIDAELTATTRTGFHRYTFNRAGEGHVVIDPTHVIGIGKHEYITLSDYLLDTELEILSDTEVSGFKHTNGSAGNRRVYFYACFSKPFQEGRIAVDDKFTDDKKAAGYNTKALLSFDMEAGEKLVVKVGLSFVSREGARKNFAAEVPKSPLTMSLQRQRLPGGGIFLKSPSKEARSGSGASFTPPFTTRCSPGDHQ